MNTTISRCSKSQIPQRDGGETDEPRRCEYEVCAFPARRTTA